MTVFANVNSRFGASLVTIVAFLVIAAAGCGRVTPLPTLNAEWTAASSAPRQLPTLSRYAVLYAFTGGPDGEYPVGDLTALNGRLYGATQGGGTPKSGCLGSGCGTIFRLTPRRSGYTVIYRFKGGRFGWLPSVGVTALNGMLYGTTAAGGDVSCDYGQGCGTIFRLAPGGSGFSVLRRFKDSGGGWPYASLIAVKGKLYGTAGGCIGYKIICQGVVFRIDPDGSGYTVLHYFKGGSNDGSGPIGRLTLLHGMLFGVTQTGGNGPCSLGCGTIFRLALSGSEFDILHAFQSGSDGWVPLAGVTALHGMLYGTTRQGGNGGCYLGDGCGTVFRLAPDGSEYSLLRRFQGGTDGEYPAADLAVVNGNLYGTTIEGGSKCDTASYSCGTAFRLAPSGAGYRTLHRFEGGTDGAYPKSGMIPLNDKLYGVTSMGGSNVCSYPYSGGCGTVFRLAP